MEPGHLKKKSQLGMDAGTAAHRLRKLIMFDLLKKLKLNYCYRCGAEIEKIDELSIEHKEPWLDSADPLKLFFDLNNIAFSHLSCNCSSVRRYTRGELKHPSWWALQKGCKCNLCKGLRNKYQSEHRRKRVKS